MVIEGFRQQTNFFGDLGYSQEQIQDLYDQEIEDSFYNSSIFPDES